MSSIGDVFLRILLDDTDFEKQVIQTGTKAGNKAGLSMGQQIAAGISKTSTQIGQSLAGIGKGLTTTGRSLSTNLTLPLLGAGAAVTHFALDFDTTMRRIVGLAKVPKEEIAGIREEILKLGGETGRAPQELGEAFYFVASAGFEAKEAMDVLRIAAKAAASGMGETQDVAKVLGGVINAYGHENITAARAGDVLTAAIQDGAAEASDFAGSIGMVVPNAAALGVSFDQVAAAMSAMTQVGIDAQTAAVNLGQILSALQKPSVQAEEAMQGLGLSSAGLRQELKEKGLLETLRTLEERFRGNETASALVFGNIRALRGVSALLGMDTEQLNGIFADTAGALDTLQKAYEDTEGPQRDMDRNLARLQATAITLGNDVLPVVLDILDQLADGAEGLAKWWKSLDDDTKKQIVQFLLWLAVAGPLLLLTGKLVTALGSMFKVIGFLTGAKGIGGLLRLLKAMRLLSFAALGPLGLLAGALVILYELLDGSDEAKQFESFAKKLGKSTKDLTKDLAKAGVSAEDFAAMVEEAGGDVDKAFDRLLHGAKKSMQDTSAAIREGGGAVVDAFGDTVVTPLDQATDDMADDMGDTPKEMADSMLANQFELKEAIDELVEFMKEAISPAKEAMNAAAFLASKAYRDGMNSGIPSVVRKTEELRDRALAALDGSGVSGQIAWDGGRAIINRWVGSMEYTLAARLAHFKLMVSRYSDVLGGSLPSAGPLQHPERGGISIGQTWVGGLLTSIRSLLPTLASSVGSVASTLMAQPMGLATASVPSMSGMAAASSMVSSSSSSSVLNLGGITIHAGSDVSPERARAFGEEILDVVANGLQEESSRFPNRPGLG